jgi:Tfp pilus assembly protein PilF
LLVLQKISGLVVGVSLLLALAGCSASRSHESRIPLDGGLDLLSVRPAAGDADRLLQNSHYFTLMGRPDLALKELAAGYQQDPQNLKLLDALARCYEELGQYDRAQKLYEEALSRQPGHAALSNNLCYSYYQAGQWDKAEKCFRAALSQNPQNAQVRNNLGLLLCRRGKVEDARKLWREVETEPLAQSKVQEVLAALGKAPASPAESGPPASEPLNLARNQSPQLPEPQLSQAPPASRQPAGETGRDQGSPERRAELSPPAQEKTANSRTYAAVSQDEEPSEVPVSQPDRVQEPPPASPPASRPSAGLTAAKDTGKLQGGSPIREDAAVPGHDRRLEQPQAAPPGASPPQEEADQQQALPQAPKKPDNPKGRRKVLLTAQELAQTAVEVLNGNGAVHLASKTRTLLELEGYHVARIGNHRDWGADGTIIYYRPESEKIAQALQANFFQCAQLSPYPDLPARVDVRLLLGRDVLQGQGLLAQLDD